MKNLIDCIIEKKFDEANSIVEESFELIMRDKLFEMKKMVAAKKMGEENLPMNKRYPDAASKVRAGIMQHELEEEDLDEEEQLDEARIKIVKARIRGGKIQRRKKLSNVKGFTMRGGKLTRMSAAERRRRKMGQRKGKIKRKAKLSRALMKRKRSLMKRKSMGLR